jgi:NAD(P)-dependent dehydrogenase (short-subunit alcohol dehydrogenase family)
MGSEAELTAVVDAAREHSAEVEPFIADVRDPAALAVTVAERRWGGLDVAVAAAGVIAGGVPLWEVIGRASLWGLAANGQAGVENVLDVLRNGIDSTLLALGRRGVHDFGREDVLVPAGFEVGPAHERGPGRGPGHAQPAQKPYTVS